MNNSKYKREKSPNKKKGILKSKKKGQKRNVKVQIEIGEKKFNKKLVKLPCHARPPSSDICHTSFIPIITNEST